MWAKLKGVLFRRHPGGDNRHGVEHRGGEFGLDRGLLHLGRRPLLRRLHWRCPARLYLRRLGNQPAPEGLLATGYLDTRVLEVWYQVHNNQAFELAVCLEKITWTG